MYPHIYTQPTTIHLTQPCNLKLTAKQDIDDLLILACISNPLIEFVVSNVHQSQCSLITRQQPFLNVELVDAHQIAEQFDYTRTQGQALRLYSKNGIAPSIVIDALRQGVELLIQADGMVYFSLDSAAKFELIPLEQDVRIQTEPNVLTMAKCILGHPFEQTDSSQKIALQISEVMHVRQEISDYFKAQVGKIHSAVSDELLKIDQLLQNKHQWLLRRYHQLIDRPGLSKASNDSSDDVEMLKHKLECYELLAPSDVTVLVNQLNEE